MAVVVGGRGRGRAATSRGRTARAELPPWLRATPEAKEPPEPNVLATWRRSWDWTAVQREYNKKSEMFEFEIPADAVSAEVIVWISGKGKIVDGAYKGEPYDVAGRWRLVIGPLTYGQRVDAPPPTGLPPRQPPPMRVRAEVSIVRQDLLRRLVVSVMLPGGSAAGVYRGNRTWEAAAQVRFYGP